MSPLTRTLLFIVSGRDRVKTAFQFIQHNVITLNLFQSNPASEDPNILRQQRYTTRTYLVLLLVTVLTIVVSTSIAGQTFYFKIDSPTLNDFIRLSRRYPLTLTCPCTQTAIDQGLVAYVEPHYHEICSSQYVLPEWIDLRFDEALSPIRYVQDIRYHWQTYFQLLSTFCQMADRTMQDALLSFSRTKFVTTDALSVQSFGTRIDSIVAHFKRTVPQTFQRTLSFVRTNLEINQFITPINSMFRRGFSHNFGILLAPANRQWPDKLDCIALVEATATVCFCHSTTLDPCYQSIVIYENNTRTPVPGMFQTWFPLHSVLLSTLECLYNETCLSQIQQLIHPAVNASNLNTLKRTSSTLNISTLVDDLFIESWSNRSSFESYFNQCRPLTCQYTVHTRLNVIYVVTKIVGLIGGVNIVLQLFLPVLVKLALKFTRKNRGVETGMNERRRRK